MTAPERTVAVDLIYLLKRLWKAQRVRLVASIGAIGVAGLLEGAAVASLVPLFQLMGGGVTGTASDSPTDAVGAAVGWVLSLVHLPLNLTTCLLMTVLLATGSQLATLGQSRLLAGSIAKLQISLRTTLYRDLMAADWPFFVARKSSDLLATVISLTLKAGEAYRLVVQLIGTGIVALIYLALAMRVSPLMTLIIGVGGAVVLFLLRRRSARGGQIGEAMNETDLDTWAIAGEHLAAAKTVKTYGFEGLAVAELDRLATRFGGLQYRLELNTGVLRYLFETISVVSVLAGVFVGVAYLHLSIALLVVFLLIFYRLSPRISAIQSLYTQMLSNIPAMRAVDSLDAVAIAAREPSGVGVVHSLERTITFEQVEFAYGPAAPVLADMSMEIPRGKTTAIVGPSGSGKTTIIDLILGLLAATGGVVLVDDVPLDELDLPAWRGRIGYVAQDGSTFHDTVSANIRLGSPGATDEQVREAARLAFADEFIGRLPEGYDTIVGDRGVRLSGGQRQRIALARALIRKPDILILDEATSALDAESEEKIQEAVRRISGGTTVIVVTHRLATVRDADTIHFLEHGRIAESGSWSELVAAGGRFADMQAQQDLSALQDGARDAG
jgi:ATP-binding cassette subfamily C protein